MSKGGKILSLCNGSYLGIDVGITNYYGKQSVGALRNQLLGRCRSVVDRPTTLLSNMLGGNLAALEIIENTDGTQTVHALYPKDNSFTYAVRESVESL